MAFFKVLNDWETNKEGDELCETFIKDRNHKKKYRNKNKYKTKFHNSLSNKQESSVLTKSLFDRSQSSHKQKNKISPKIAKSKEHPKKIKNKYGGIHMPTNGEADDKIPLNSFFNCEPEKEEKYENKKSVKRKRSFSETTNGGGIKPLKKIKTEMTRKYAEPTSNDNSNPSIQKLKNTKLKKKSNGNIAQEQSSGGSKNQKNKINKLLTNVKVKNILHTAKHMKMISNNLKEKKKLPIKPDTDANSKRQSEENKIDPIQLQKHKKQLKKLQHLLSERQKKHQPLLSKKEPVLTLRQKMMQKLKAARFRFLNEQIYTTTSRETEKIFRSDPDAFKSYHEGYRQQVKRWPLNPLDRIIKSVNKMPKTHVVADFGCGEARLANSVEHKVYSFDLVAANDAVTACDMAHVPLQNSSIDVAVYCLSLMGTNLKDYLVEANRVLKKGGLLKIAEVESRFEDIKGFTKDCEQFGFKKTWMDLSHNLFYFIDFRKENNIKGKKKLPALTLQPCLYKKR